MKKFLLRATLFASLCIGTVVAVLSLNDPAQDVNTSYMAAIINKHLRLDSLAGNRLILVGGSNLAFGMNCTMLEKGTGKNVVNLGLHGGLGSEFIINEIKENVKENDIILLSFEYSLYDDSYAPYNDLIAFTQKIYPEAKDYYQLTLIQKLEVYMGNFVKKITQNNDRPKDSPYNRKGFNKYGDDTAHLNQQGLKSLSGSLVMNKIRLNKIIGRLKELSTICAKKHAALYLMYPDYAKSEFSLNHEVIKDLEQQVNKDISFIKVINKPETFVFDDNLFYDTVYHLTREGIKLRTTLLLKILNGGLISPANN